MNIPSLKSRANARPQTAVLRPVSSAKTFSTIAGEKTVGGRLHQKISLKAFDSFKKDTSTNNNKLSTNNEKTDLQNDKKKQTPIQEDEENDQLSSNRQANVLNRRASLKRRSSLLPSAYRPHGSNLGDPARQINYTSKVFTTDVISIDKQMDNMEELIARFHNRPRSTEKTKKIDIDLNRKYQDMMHLQVQIMQQRELLAHFNNEEITSNTLTRMQAQMSNKEEMFRTHGQATFYSNSRAPDHSNSRSAERKISPQQPHIEDQNFDKRYNSKYLMSQSKKVKQHRLQSASTKYTFNQAKSSMQQSVGGSNSKLRLDSAKTIGSPLSRNFIQSSALMSQLSQVEANSAVKQRPFKEQKRLKYSASQSSNLQRAAEYQEFFIKNANHEYGIANLVMKGSKIKAERKARAKEEQREKNQEVMSPAGADAAMQTEENESIDELDEEDDFGNFFSKRTHLDKELYNEQIEEEDDNYQFKRVNLATDTPVSPIEPRSKEPNLLFKGAHVKVYQKVKEVQKRERPSTAGPLHVKQRFVSARGSNNTSQHSPIKLDLKSVEAADSIVQEENNIFSDKMKLQELYLNINDRVDLSKLNQTFKNEYSLQQSIFRDKKQKILELGEYLELVLHDFQSSQFKDNEKEIDQTISRFNLNDQLTDNMESIVNTKRTFNGSAHEQEQKQEVEEAQIQSTGLRLRRLTAKYGPKVDLVSHGFQHFRVADIEKFFDPLRLKLMMVPLSDIPNLLTKQGSDFFFIKGMKLQQSKDLQAALNSYEEGIREYPNSSYNCKFNKGVLLFKLGMFKEALQVYRQIFREEPLDKRLTYNKALCEIQNGLYGQAMQSIDMYINDFNERKERYDRATKGGEANAISYQEKIQMTKQNYIPDDQYLFEIYQIRGVACLRSRKVVEASRSFKVAQEFSQALQRRKLVQKVNTSSVDSSKANSVQLTPIYHPQTVTPSSKPTQFPQRAVEQIAKNQEVSVE